MSKPATNPFFETDFSKFMDMSKMMDITKMMDVSKMMDMSNITKMMDVSKMGDMSKMMGMGMGNMKMPSVDLEAIMAIHRKNIDAITSANRVAYEGMQNFARRQGELARQSFESATTLIQAIASAQTPEDKLAKQADATKATMQNCIKSVKELTDMLAQNQYQALENMSKCVADCMDEMQNVMSKSLNKPE